MIYEYLNAFSACALTFFITTLISKNYNKSNQYKLYNQKSNTLDKTTIHAEFEPLGKTLTLHFHNDDF